MRIGELATKAGVNVQSVRFYERRRILQEPVRSASGYRVYSKSDLDDICFIKQCQELGFTLKEIQPLLRLHRAAARTTVAGERCPAEFREIAQWARVKVEEIDGKMRALKSMRLRLIRMVDRIETVSSVGCPGQNPPAAAKCAAEPPTALKARMGHSSPKTLKECKR